VARTHDPRRLPIARQVDVMACHLAQPLAGDCLSCAMSRSMVEHCRWLDRLELEIDGDAMPLVRADQGAGRIDEKRRLLFRATTSSNSARLSGTL
jgi:hypothetical protein